MDVAAAAVLAAIVAAFLFGETDAESLSREGEVGAPLLLLPVLVALAGALLAARAFPALLRLGERPAAAAGVSSAWRSCPSSATPALPQWRSRA